MSDNPTPSHATIVDAAFAKRVKKIRVALPGRVESYDPTTQRANVQPLIQEAFEDDQGSDQVDRLPVVTNVPICFPGSGPYRLTWPVSVGDTVLLVFCSSSIDKWLARGGEVDPEDGRHHHIGDAVAIPGLFDFAHVPTTAPSTAMVVFASALKLGDDTASDPVARKSDLQAIVTQLASHVHPGVTTGGGSSLAVVPGTFTTPTCSPVVSSK